MSKDGLKTYGWFLLWVSLLLTALLCRPPLPIDETRYLSVAWEMWQNHQFLVPHINGIPYSHKPPLLFRLIQAGWLIFGVNEWSARMTAPIFGLFTVMLTIGFARMLWPNQRELRKNIPYILLGSCLWSFYGTLTMFDMLIAFFSVIAWVGLWVGREGKRLLCWILYGAAAGLGILAKGPVILVYIVPPALLAPWWMGKDHVRSWIWWYCGLITAIAGGAILALAWAIPASHAGGEQYAQAILYGQTAGRVVHSFAHQRPMYWYLLLLPLLLFPWSCCQSLWTGVIRMQLTPSVRFCISCILPAIVLFSVISGKQIHYLLPLFPVVFLLVGHGVDSGTPLTAFSRRLLPIALFFFALILLIVPMLHLEGGDSEMLRFLPWWLGFGPLVAAFSLYKYAIKPKQCIAVTSTIFTGLLIFLHISMMASLRSLYTGQDIGEKILNVQISKGQVAVFPEDLSGQFQFAGKLINPLAVQKTMKDIVLWSDTHPGQSVLLFLGADVSPYFSNRGFVRPYKNGRLIFRPATGVHDSLNAWLAKINAKIR